MSNSKEDFDLSVEVSAVLEAQFKEVWDTLFKINVNEHTEKKGNLTYLSWAWAYATMMNNYPTFSYRFPPQEDHPDGTVTVFVECNILKGGVDLRRSMWLPVMDYRNKAISNPDSMAINTAKMRCLTKCISMYGLGSYIYAGEDLPEEPTDGEGTKAKPAPKKKAATKKAAPKKAKVTPIKGKAKKDNAKPVEQKEVQDDFYCEDEEAAEEYAQFMINTATEMHSGSKDSLIEFWRINLNASNYLKENFPDQYKVLLKAFGELKEKLIEGEDNE